MIIRVIPLVILAGLSAACLSTAVRAQTGPLTLANGDGPENNEFVETLLDAAEISGQVVVGVQRDTGGGTALEISVHVPGGWQGDLLCVRAESADGLYEAANTYRIRPGWTGGWVPVPWPRSTKRGS